MRTKNHILTLLENGMTMSTISNFTDNQIMVLAEKFSKKKENKEQWTKNVSQETTYTAPVTKKAHLKNSIKICQKKNILKKL